MSLQKKLVLVFLAGMLLSACAPQLTVTPAAATETPVQVPATATVEIAPTATETPVPTQTSTPTITPIPTFSPAQVEIIGIGQRNDATFLTLELHTVEFKYYLLINRHEYPCELVDGYENRLYCVGKVIPYRTWFEYSLVIEDNDLTVFTDAHLGYLPPVGGNPDWTCEVEPLWVPPLTGNYGCYAVTCFSRSSGAYVGGTVDSCINPFPFWLYQTPNP